MADASVRKHVEALRGGENLAITHDLGTTDVVIQIYNPQSELVHGDVSVVSEGQVNVSINDTSMEPYKVIILG